MSAKGGPSIIKYATREQATIRKESQWTILKLQLTGQGVKNNILLDSYHINCIPVVRV